MTTRVSVIGSGNAGLTAAYHFTLHGAKVCLYGSKGFDQPLADIEKKGGIEALASFNDVSLTYSGFQPIDKVSRDLEETLRYANLVVMPVPSFAQEALFIDMLPYLRDGQIIMLMPGNYGSLVLNRIKFEQGFENLDITFVDAISIPWATRIVGPAQLAILGMKSFLPVAALPATRTENAIAALQEVMPLQLTALNNVIESGLENINFGGHPLMTSLNMGLLENFDGQFNYYKDCCSISTAKAAAVMEKERLAVGEALGLTLKPELEAMNSLYDMNCTSVYDVNRTSETHGKLNSAPNSASNRYITEDAAYLLVPCYEFAQLANIDTPIITSCLHIDNAYNDTNYFETGRTLEKMGLSNLTIEEIMECVA
ncbi:NAD/NADP octopine/nopaline dehydrogenase family protein [Vibrio scophthalmi]|uniref:Opine dehydrogenase n=1 Tax=Vibrio scophthalmi TaxID=45658 RepID=A0A1B1NME8_9VIBR|nr:MULTISPECIES: NAD/NADP octopine/nopaline dehydrogenase family protein [Vibrio]ANS84872.1 Opine dehydrogenase [Vibrio scophthalmi]EGU30321.1 NAD/NADP octopine/nopalinedehydrogenae [Vibrio sp. N418]MCY9802161.1 NAD/NADP octopine/nopaline dehydrogenase family protein [Vibrio scophthalmi]ODS11966.1 Opine dehydrogenase [Vibrio scophthalmi]